MKRRFLGISILCAVSITAVHAGPMYRDSCYSVGLTGAYAYNETYEHYGSVSVNAYLPVHKYFEGAVDIRCQTANVYDFSARLRPKFILPVGELYFETQILYNLISRNNLHGVCAMLHRSTAQKAL